MSVLYDAADAFDSRALIVVLASCAAVTAWLVPPLTYDLVLVETRLTTFQMLEA
jgi:hypothetical protein